MSDSDGEAGEEERHAIARNVVELRHRRGMTQLDLVERTGIKQANISAIEQGAANVTVRTLARIAQALGVEAGTLLRRPGKK